jgi:hypothetical protein
MSTPTITEFLEARIAEDEAVAREWDAAYNNPGPVPEYHYSIMRKHRKEWPTLWGALDKMPPARVLAECAAKRAIVEFADQVETMDYQITNEWGGGLEGTGNNILKALAAVYASHPDYLQEWAL